MITSGVTRNTVRWLLLIAVYTPPLTGSMDRRGAAGDWPRTSIAVSFARLRTLFPVHVHQVFFVLAEVFVQFGVRHEIERNRRGPRPLVIFRIGECELDHHVAKVG